MPAPRLRHGAPALLAAAALALGGCAATGDPLEPVVEGQWTLAAATRGGGQLNFAGTTVTLTAAADGFSGIGPCNAYGAAIAGDTANLEVLSLIPAEETCDDAVMELETAYFGLLLGATTAARDNGQLVLAGDEGELRFDPAPTGGAADALAGTTWNLQSVTAQGAEVPIAPGPDGAAPSLTFGADGRTSGSTGCRDIALDYAVTDGQVQFDGFPAETPECPAETAAQDDVLFTLLGFGFPADTTDGVLTVENAEFGLVATFTS
ncbi:META domain-containing protein [Arenivirga flava]|uniref:DUF306 domain-containing protein n=1 Tax=Arenivirga flava TaxID=1930060 RepID=A0AA37USY4_9MICO|nr:META domain-containing protein [Arenivirga flava]GMA29646.1 hypothetical protein GCM10025874_28990 [Arenivirga flava]